MFGVLGQAGAGDCSFETILTVTGPLFDGLHEYHRRAMLLGHEPA